MKKDVFFYLIFRKLVRVIWIYSKLVNVVDVKLIVFMNYEFFFKKDKIYIYYIFEDFDNVIKFLVY